jgi:hypothetical protein
MLTVYTPKAEEYSLSLSVYYEEAGQLLGRKLALEYLYFTETGEFWWVEVDEISRLISEMKKI